MNHKPREDMNHVGPTAAKPQPNLSKRTQRKRDFNHEDSKSTKDRERYFSRRGAEITEMIICRGEYQASKSSLIHEKSNPVGVEHTKPGAAPLKESGAPGIRRGSSNQLTCVFAMVGTVSAPQKP
jgi:hypothetical protein